MVVKKMCEALDLKIATKSMGNQLRSWTATPHDLQIPEQVASHVVTVTSGINSGDLILLIMSYLKIKPIPCAVFSSKAFDKGNHQKA